MRFELLQNGQIVDMKEFEDGSYKIGRAPESDLCLKSPQVSKQHALLIIKNGQAAIVDVGSANGVFVNGVLVKRQRVSQRDEIVIADYVIRISRALPTRRGARVAVTSGNAAENLEFQSAEVSEEGDQEPIPPQERLLQLMDQKVMVHFFQLMKTVDWRVMLSSILMAALVLSVFLSVIPIVRWGRNTTVKESLARAHTILAQTVRENYRVLAKTNDFTRLTVDAAESEKGILTCYILDPKTNAILAPAKLFNKTVSDVYSLLAIKRVTEEKEESVSVEVGDDLYIVAQPIYLFSQDSNERSLSAIVVAQFQVKGAIYSTFEPLVEAALFSLLLSLGAYFLIFKMFTHPIASFQEQVDAALKGENVMVESTVKLPELESLATVINYAISRFKQSGPADASSIQSSDTSDGDAVYIRTVEEFDSSTSDGILLLDKDKKVRFVGRIIEDLIGMRQQYAVGQNISDACRDQSFAGTAIDLCDNVIQSLGQSQSSQLEINGISRTVAAVAHRDPSGEIAFILVTVKMNA